MIKIIILSILLVITLIAIKKNTKKQSKEPEKPAEEKGCKYNEMNMCWNRCCNFCFEKEACIWACKENYNSCGGYK